MATFKLNPSYSWKAITIQCQGSFTDLLPNSATANRQINPALVTVATANGGFIGADGTNKPVASTPFSIYARPQGGQPAAAGNFQPLPTGITTTAPVAGEYVVDCSAWAADIMSASANLIPMVRGAFSSNTAVAVSAIDNVAKLVYLQCYTVTTGAAVPLPATNQVSFDIVMTDSYTP